MKMFDKRKLVNIVIVIITVIMYSCSPATYVRNTINSPLFEDKNEFQASAYMNLGELDLQTAYSLTSHIGVTANLYTALPKSVFIKEGTYSQKKYDFSLGYYTHLNDKNYISAFVGGGQGFLEGDVRRHWANDYNIEWIKYNTDYIEGYLQLNYYRKYNNWDIGFSLRNNFVHYKEYNYANYKDEYTGFSPVPIVFTDTIQQYNLNGFVFDPVINLQYKSKKLRLLGQFGYSISSFNVENRKLVNNMQYNYLTKHDNAPRYQRLIFKLGIQYTFGRKKTDNI